jgi:hypothetical protein
MNDTTLVAIDPGANGGYMVRLAWKQGEILTGSLPDTEGDTLELIRSWSSYGKRHVAYLENLVKFTGSPMPSSAMATYASSWGILKGFLMAHKFQLVLVSPQKWQKELGLGTSKGMSKTDWKNKLKSEGQRLYPNCKITLANADAALIFRYAELAERRG